MDDWAEAEAYDSDEDMKLDKKGAWTAWRLMFRV